GPRPVPRRCGPSLRVDPGLEGGVVRVTANTAGAGERVTATVLDGTREVATASATSGSPMSIRVPNAHKWSPADPFLYGLRVRLASGDSVDSYFGMRRIAVKADSSGARRLFLNGEEIFQLGLLDQGWWPDGLYTAPTDAA